jgi:hypothetical protein
MAKKSSSAMTCVLAAAEAARSQPLNKRWTRFLPPEGQAEMAEIRREWQCGRLQGVQIVVVYRGIVARCMEEKWPAPKSETTIMRWLRSSDS